MKLSILFWVFLMLVAGNTAVNKNCQFKFYHSTETGLSKRAVNIEERSWRILPSSHHRRSPITPWLIPKRRRSRNLNSRNPSSRSSNKNNSPSRKRLSQRPNKSRSLVSARYAILFSLARHCAFVSTWRKIVLIPLYTIRNYDFCVRVIDCSEEKCY